MNRLIYEIETTLVFVTHNFVVVYSLFSDSPSNYTTYLNSCHVPCYVSGHHYHHITHAFFQITSFTNTKYLLSTMVYACDPYPSSPE